MADYQAVVAHCSGSWHLSPGNAASVQGAPACVETLTISFPDASQLTQPSHEKRQYGSAIISFCGEVNTVSITSVLAAGSIAVAQAGAGPPPQSESAIFGFAATLPDPGAPTWSVFWWPTESGGEAEHESLVVQFSASPFFERPGQGSSEGYSPCLTFERDS